MTTEEKLYIQHRLAGRTPLASAALVMCRINYGLGSSSRDLWFDIVALVKHMSKLEQQEEQAG